MTEPATPSSTTSTRSDPGDVAVLIVVDSWQGHTVRVAERVAEGARSQCAVVVLRSADSGTRADLIKARALIMGSAGHQRAMIWRMRRFVDEVCEPAWSHDDLGGRVGAVFTAGGGAGGAGGGAESAQLGMLTNLAACGMVLVTMPKDTPGAEYGGIHWGPTIRTTTDDMRPIEPGQLAPEQQLAFFHHGTNVAGVAQRLRGLALPAANRMPAHEAREMRAASECGHALDTRWGHSADASRPAS